MRQILLAASDEMLIAAYIDGDNNAFANLVLRHKEKIYSAIYLLVKDKFLAEDLFQEVFIKIIDTLKRGSYNEEGKFLPWALRIARNLCLDHFRKAKRTPVIKTGDNRDIFEILNFAEPNIEEKIVREETYTSVKQMLALLPEDQREVIILRHFADLSFKEIAELTGCSINTALGRMRYALLNLRKMMGERAITFGRA